MDPLTGGLNLGNAALLLFGKVFDALPEAQKAQAATDLVQPLHNIITFLTSLQQKINDAVK